MSVLKKLTVHIFIQRSQPSIIVKSRLNLEVQTLKLTVMVFHQRQKRFHKTRAGRASGSSRRCWTCSKSKNCNLMTLQIFVQQRKAESRAQNLLNDYCDISPKLIAYRQNWTEKKYKLLCKVLNNAKKEYSHIVDSTNFIQRRHTAYDC